MEYGCIFSRINQIGTISNKFLIKRIKEEGLPILQNHVLLFYILPEDKSPLLFSEIARIWDISKSSLSDIINKYESIGIVKKSICTEDKRNIYINLTEDGINIKHKLEEIESEALKIMLENFDKNQKDNFEEYVNKALENIKKML